MSKIIQTKNPLNPIQVTDGFESRSEKRVLIVGGWEQNPVLVQRFQDELLARGVASAAFSGFDTIDPRISEDEVLENECVQHVRGYDAFVASLPPRMVLRALATAEMTRVLMEECQLNPVSFPTRISTHCAGANVYLLARYLELRAGHLRLLPSSGVLFEPMIAEGRAVMDVAKQNMKHEKQAKSDARYISLASMRHPDAVNLGFDGKLPMSDILDSRGLALLGHNTLANAKLSVVLGYEDIAAPDSLMHDISGMALDIPVSRYRTDAHSERFGHGYLFAEPTRVAEYLASVL
mgnify:CR=1 FL=1